MAFGISGVSDTPNTSRRLVFVGVLRTPVQIIVLHRTIDLDLVVDVMPWYVDRQ